MTDFFIYLLKVCIGTAIIAIPYFFLLRKDPNLRLKRFFLLGGLILSFIAPLTDISFLATVKPEVPVLFLDIDPIVSENESANINNNSGGTDIAGRFSLFGLLYIAGTFLFLGRGIFSFIYWRGIKNTSNPEQDKVLFSERNEVFSFFNYIHLPNIHKRSEEHTSLLYHEQAHIRQLHFIDLIISEIALLITWFNPFTWLIYRMIKENHEHLADREVLARGIDPAFYRAHLLNQTLGVPVFSFGQSFNHSLTKKRFDMMKNSKSKRSGLVKTVIILPVLLFLIGFLNSTQAQEEIIKGKLKFSDTGKAAHGVHVIVKGTQLGTITNEQGEFSLKAPGKCEVVFSFVGYETEKVSCKPGNKIKLSLEPKTYEVNIQPIDKHLSSDSHTESVSERKQTENSSEDMKDKMKDDEDKPIDDRKRNSQQLESTEVEHVFYVVEDVPKFQEGNKSLQRYIYSNLNYPAEAKKEGKEGIVYVRFTVDQAGAVKNAKVEKSTDPVFNSEAIRIFKTMPAWNPGTQRNMPVPVKLTVPVYFRLNSGN